MRCYNCGAKKINLSYKIGEKYFCSLKCKTGSNIPEQTIITFNKMDNNNVEKQRG
jgi:hypothetical protein